VDHSYSDLKANRSRVQCVYFDVHYYYKVMIYARGVQHFLMKVHNC